MVDLDPTLGHEQPGRRPGLVISVDALNQSAAELAVVLPLTSRNKGIRSHVAVPAEEAGLKVPSYVKCEDVRSLSTQRLKQRLGSVSPATLEAVEVRLRILLGL